VYEPDGLLAVMLHGGFGSVEQAESSYPDAVARAWNGGPARDGIDDVGLVTAAVDDLAEHRCDRYQQRRHHGLPAGV